MCRVSTAPPTRYMQLEGHLGKQVCRVSTAPPTRYMELEGHLGKETGVQGQHSTTHKVHAVRLTPWETGLLGVSSV